MILSACIIPCMSEGLSCHINLYGFILPRHFVSTSGLAITAKQAKKKWNNLKDKYKVICLFLLSVTERALPRFV